MNLNCMMKEYWGFEELRPLQREAMECVLEGRDSLVVLPTGGGKSLCFQAPALVMEGLSVVVSPLISLMKDQVDGLKAAGIAAAFLNSSLEPDDHRRVLADMNPVEAVELLKSRLEKVKTNAEFLMTMNLA